MSQQQRVDDYAKGAHVRGRSAQNRDSRILLILAAEKHFALHGFGGTSLKDIHEAAGQRNASAIHYYFGSRDGLIGAILDYRVPPRSEQRQAAIKELQKLQEKPSLRDLLVVWIEQFASELRPRAEGNYYIRFLDQLRRTGPARIRAKAGDMQVGYGSLFEMIAESMPAISPRLKRSRLAMTAELAVSGLAQLEGALPSTRTSQADYPTLAIANLVDFVTAGLATPPDAGTIAVEGSSSSEVDFQFNFTTQC